MNANKQQTKKIPRPMNCFLAFRLEKQGEILTRCPGANHRDISKIIAKWWKETPEHEKEPYREKARISKIEHSKLHPDYKYSPNKRPGHKPRKYVRRVKDTFTSRSAENNRLMKLLYTDPRKLENKTNAIQTPIYKETKHFTFKQETSQASYHFTPTVEKPDCEFTSRSSYTTTAGIQESNIPIHEPNYSFVSYVGKDVVDQNYCNSFAEKDQLVTPPSNVLDCSIPTPFYQNVFVPSQPEEYFYITPSHQQTHPFSPVTTPVYHDNSPSSGSSVCFSPLEYKSSPPIAGYEYSPILDQSAYWSMIRSDFSSPDYLGYLLSNERVLNEQTTPEAYIDPSLLMMPSAPPRDLSYVGNQSFNDILASTMFPF